MIGMYCPSEFNIWDNIVRYGIGLKCPKVLSDISVYNITFEYFRHPQIPCIKSISSDKQLLKDGINIEYKLLRFVFYSICVKEVLNKHNIHSVVTFFDYYNTSFLLRKVFK